MSAAILGSVTKILAALAALRAKVMDSMTFLYPG
jgi:hypothetical protein